MVASAVAARCSPVKLTYSIDEPFCTDLISDDLALPPYQKSDPRNEASNYRDIRVHAQIPKHESELPSFEVIMFILHGIVKSELGNQVATKRILRASETRKWSDFRTCHKNTNTSKRRPDAVLCCDVNFRIEGGAIHQENSTCLNKPTTSPQLLSSTHIEASRYISQSTVLSDRHLVRGQADVIYWVEARYIPSTGSDQSVDPGSPAADIGRVCTNKVLDLRFRPTKARLMPAPTSLKESDGNFTVEAQIPGLACLKEKCQSLFSPGSRHTGINRPRLIFSIQEAMFRNLDMRPITGHQSSISVPITMRVRVPPTNTFSSSALAQQPRTALKRYLSLYGFPNTVTVTHTWNTRYRFTTCPGSTRGEQKVMEKNTVRCESQVVSIPPFYETEDGQYTATALVEVSLPATTSVTVDTGLLRIQHLLSFGIKVAKAEDLDSGTPVNDKQWAELEAGPLLDLVTGMTADIHVECFMQM